MSSRAAVALAPLAGPGTRRAPSSPTLEPPAFLFLHGPRSDLSSTRLRDGAGKRIGMGEGAPPGFKRLGLRRRAKSAKLPVEPRDPFGLAETLEKTQRFGISSDDVFRVIRRSREIAEPDKAVCLIDIITEPLVEPLRFDVAGSRLVAISGKVQVRETHQAVRLAELVARAFEDRFRFAVAGSRRLGDSVQEIAGKPA